MPSEIMESHGISPSSFLSEEVQHPNERQIGFRKADGMPDNYGLKDGKAYAVGDSSDSHMLNVPNLYRSQEHNKVHISLLDNSTVGAGRTVGHSLSLRRPVDNNDKGNRSNPNMEHKTYLTARNVMGDHYENGLFSSSLSDLFTRKLRLSANTSTYGHSVGAAASRYEEEEEEEEEPFESLEEIEAQTIGNLLPDDDDLLSGVTDGLDCKMQPGSGDDVEELDFFSSVGGMELGEDGGYEISAPHAENPSRTLFVRNINSNVEDSELRVLFEQYGEIRTLHTACKHRGFVMISYYDVRAARRAMQALQNKPLRRRKLDIHYSIPKDNPSDKDTNQGTVAIFNLDSNVSNDELRHIFGVYGEVKEIRDGSHHKSIEFYDIRAAEAALRELNKSDIGGKLMKLEPSGPGGSSKRFSSPFPELDADETSALLQMCSAPLPPTTGGPVSQSHGMDKATLLGVSAPQLLLDAQLQHDAIVVGGGVGSGGMNQLKYDFRTTPNYVHHPHSLPDGLTNSFLCNSPTTMGMGVGMGMGMAAASLNCRMSERVGNRQQQFNRIGGRSLEVNDTVFGSSGNASHHYMWNPNPSHQQQQTHNMMWSNSPSLLNGVGNAHSAPLVHALPRAPSHSHANSFLHINNHHHHVGSAPSVNPSIWDRRHSYGAGESPDAVFHAGSLGNMRVPGLDFVSHNMFPPHMGDMPVPSKPIGLASHHQNQPNVMFPIPSRGGQMIPVFDSSSDRPRIRRNEAASNQADNKKQFELDLDRIMRGDDRRTTLMIKNIPNKYTSKMLLAAIDERHRGTYDFIYLPIDFKNKCNVGYAFINMTDPSLIIPFYQAFNGKKWEKFNSEKVASLAYARIQGKAALIAHFQNSSLMNEDKRCRPILFHTDGPNAGDQVPFPMGVNVRSRASKNRNNTNEESSQDVGDGEASSNGGEGDSSSGSTKDFEC